MAERTDDNDGYTPVFAPVLGTEPVSPVEVPTREGDQSPPSTYVFDDRGTIQLRVNVALVTGRPLLVRGPPGCGKSSLARTVAASLGWSYLHRYVTSRDQASDLQWTFDAVRRLRDAQAGEQDTSAQRYLTPGVLWWGFDADSASWAGDPDESGDPRHKYPAEGERRTIPRAVVLIDEIDKGDPDLPNDLLEALGSRRFTVDETGYLVQDAHHPFVIITTNAERQLPEAFLRRCVTLELGIPDKTRMMKIAGRHFPSAAEDDIQMIYDKFEALREDAKKNRLREPGTAEFLDAVGAVEGLRPTEKEHWNHVVRSALWKHALRRGAADEEIDDR